MFSHILVAIDFANQPLQLYQYGLDLGNQLGCSIELIHVFHPSQIKGRLRANKKEEELLAYFEKRMQKLKLPTPSTKVNFSSRPSPSVLIRKKVISGFPELELLKFAQDPEVDLLVMGTRGFSYPFNGEFGSVVTSVSQDAQCPVLLLPPDAMFSGINKILFINDDEVISSELLESITGLAFLFNAEIHFMHVDHHRGKSKEELLKGQFEEGIQAIGSKDGYFFSYSKVENLLVNVNKQIQKHQIDFINIMSVNRFLWFDFLKHQMKNTYQLSRDIPILINHLDA